MEQKYIDRFWSKVTKSGPDDCWEWNGGRFDTGYGALWVGSNNVGAHRVSLALSLGKSLADVKVACHTCDNPPCVNPNHLFDGSYSDNILDAYAKGRSRGWGSKDSCRRGHAYVDGSYWIRKRSGKESRVCKECDKIRGEKRRGKDSPV